MSNSAPSYWPAIGGGSGNIMTASSQSVAVELGNEMEALLAIGDHLQFNQPQPMSLTIMFEGNKPAITFTGDGELQFHPCQEHDDCKLYLHPDTPEDKREWYRNLARECTAKSAYVPTKVAHVFWESVRATGHTIIGKRVLELENALRRIKEDLRIGERSIYEMGAVGCSVGKIIDDALEGRGNSDGIRR